MDDTDISPYITLTKVRSGEKLQIEQKYVKIREGQNKFFEAVIITFKMKNFIFLIIVHHKIFYFGFHHFRKISIIITNNKVQHIKRPTL